MNEENLESGQHDAETAPQEPSEESQSGPSEAEKAMRTRLLVVIALLGVALVVIGITRMDEISSFFGDAENKEDSRDVLSKLRDEDGALTPPVSIVITKGVQKTEFKALPTRWAIANANNARVQPNSVRMLMLALDASAKDFDPSDETPGASPSLEDPVEVVFGFENGESHTISVSGEDIVYQGAKRKARLPGLSVDALPESWIPLSHDLMTDFDYSSFKIPEEKKINPDNFGGIRSERKGESWEALKTSGGWLVNAASEGRSSVLNASLYWAQHLNIDGLWTGETPELHAFSIFNDHASINLRVSYPTEGDYAALEIDRGAALYKISAISARALLPSNSDVVDTPVVPPDEGEEGVEILGRGAGFEIILIRNNRSHGVDPMDQVLDPKGAREFAEKFLERLLAIEDEKIRATEFATILSEITHWRDEKGETMRKLEAFPAHHEEFMHVLNAIKDLAPGAIAPRVFSTAYGDVIVWHRKEF